MKVTKSQLKQIIKEELEAVLKERSPRLTRDRRGAPSQVQTPSEQDPSGPTEAECTALKGVMGKYKPENPQELEMVKKCKELYFDI